MSTRDDMRVAKRLMRLAKKYGATGVTCSVSSSTNEAIEVRDQCVEKFEATIGERQLGLSVLVGKREASIESECFGAQHCERLVERVVAMAKVATENPYAAIAPRELWPCDPACLTEKEAFLERCDKNPPPRIGEMKALALELERSALHYPDVTKSSGASVSRGMGTSVFMTSEGFIAEHKGTSYTKSVSMIAARGSEMQSGGDYHSARHFADLRSNEECARRAGESAVMLLGAKPIATQVMPVIFDPRVAVRILGWFFGATNGRNVHFKSTFLLDKKYEQLFPDDVTITDDPHIPRKFGSRLYDAECVKTARHELVRNGRLMMWTTSMESGLMLGIPSSGHASGKSNLLLSFGSVTRAELCRSVPTAFLVTGLLGHGPNIATGDFSSGAEGLLLKDGEIIHPVNEVTIAGNLLDMWKTMRHGSDREEYGSVSCPSLLFDRMTVSGA
ncbi:MAG: TldD/PmbA family protein [Patescibacteria group bacterium]